MDWRAMHVHRSNAASSINMKETSVQSKPWAWNVPLLSCAPGPHFCSGFFLSCPRSRSELNATVHFSVELGSKAVAVLILVFIPSLPDWPSLLCVFFFFEMLHVSECFCAIWNHTHEDGWGSVRCWEGLLLTRGNPFLTRMFLELFWASEVHLTALLAARSNNYLKFSW